MFDKNRVLCWAIKRVKGLAQSIQLCKIKRKNIFQIAKEIKTLLISF